MNPEKTNPKDWDWSKFDLPKDCAELRDMLRSYLQSQVDHGSNMDTGGGLGCADLWVTFGGVEYTITVSGGGPEQIYKDRMEMAEQVRKILNQGADYHRNEAEKLRALAMNAALRMVVIATDLQTAKRIAVEALGGSDAAS